MTVLCETGEGLYNRKFIDCTTIIFAGQAIHHRIHQLINAFLEAQIHSASQ